MCLLQKMSFKKFFFYEKEERWSEMTLSWLVNYDVK